MIVELVDRDFEVGGGLKLDKPGNILVVVRLNNPPSLPFAITVAANLRVDNIKARATCEIFQVLWSYVSPIPVPMCRFAAWSILRELLAGRVPVPENDQFT